MSGRFRQVIAASEFIGGSYALLLSTTATRTGGLAPWVAIVLAMLGALSILAGILLWRDRLLGYRMSLVLQGAQMLQIQSAALVYRVLAGIQVAVWIREGGRIGAASGLGALFSVGGGTETWLFGANLWAVAAFLALEARPARAAAAPDGATQGEAPIATPNAEPESRVG